MLTRRTFLHTVAGSAAALAAPAPLRAAQHDLLIKGGRVIDPASRLDGAADVAISGGRIAAVGRRLPASSAAEVIDAGGRLVTPGLIDIHTHIRSAEMPSICLSEGVTSLVDAGSRGADQIDSVVAFARQAPNRSRVLINIARTGVIDEGELMDLSHADVDAAREAITRHRDIVVGIKVRLSRTVAGTNDQEALRRAQTVARPLALPLMVHVGNTASTMPDLLALLKPGDIVTHLYAPPPNSIFDSRGRVSPEVHAARRRGILFDVGHGRIGHFTWQTMEDGLTQGFPPDTISSDWTDAGRTNQVVDFANVLSKFLMLGMPLDQVIARGTVRAAAAFPAFKGLGTLRVGAPADVAILELREGAFEFLDNAGTRRPGRQRLMARAVFAGGRRV